MLVKRAGGEKNWWTEEKRKNHWSMSMTDESKWVGSCDQREVLLFNKGTEISSRKKLGQRWAGRTTAAAQAPCWVTWVPEAQSQQGKLKVTLPELFDLQTPPAGWEVEGRICGGNGHWEMKGQRFRRSWSVRQTGWEVQAWDSHCRVGNLRAILTSCVTLNTPPNASKLLFVRL